MTIHTERIERLRAQLRGVQADAFISAFGPHLRYFAGFSGSTGMILVTHADAFFFTDFRYKEQSAFEVTACRRIISRDSFAAASKRRVFSGLTSIVVDDENCSYRFVTDVRRSAPEAVVVPAPALAAQCMVCKDEGEIDSLRRAASISDRVFADLLGLIRPGLAELDLAAEIVSRHRRYGAEGDAFDVIVASGARGSLPHARPSAKTIAAGDFVTMDFGCVFNGYHSDLTRTVAVGKATREMKTVYSAVLDAQQAAIDVARAGITGRQLDLTARSVIAKRGYGKYFVHGLGHGIGLQIHEEPRVSRANTEQLPEGAVITIEPGIYLPGKFGVRIEDDAALQTDGCSVITASPKELIIL
jgi:Xaa-Pro aminopeptidase